MSQDSTTDSSPPAFALFALVLAMGICGVMSYLVTQGTHDPGGRIALGAQQSNIVRRVVGRGLELAATGIAAGLLGAAALMRDTRRSLGGASGGIGLRLLVTCAGK